LIKWTLQRPNSDLGGHRSLLHYQSLAETGSGLLTPRLDDEETIIEMEAASPRPLSDFNASPPRPPMPR
jgi:hypothetical protein